MILTFLFHFKKKTLGYRVLKQPVSSWDPFVHCGGRLLLVLFFSHTRKYTNYSWALHPSQTSLSSLPPPDHWPLTTGPETSTARLSFGLRYIHIAHSESQAHLQTWLSITLPHWAHLPRPICHPSARLQASLSKLQLLYGSNVLRVYWKQTSISAQQWQHIYVTPCDSETVPPPFPLCWPLFDVFPLLIYAKCSCVLPCYTGALCGTHWSLHIT